MGGNTSFGYWVRRRRKALDLTQHQLAQRVGCSEVTIRKIEADQRRPSRPFAERLADLLEIAPAARTAFLEAARAESSPDRLDEPTSDIGQAPPYVAPAAANLPAPTTPLIGRAGELAHASTLLESANVRLLTLTGPGGVGKTRLALAVAAALHDSFADGISFVALAPIRDPDLALSSIAQALGVKDSGGQPLIERIKSYLRNQRVLLLLDNFEQLTAAAPLIGELLAAAPQLKALVTSRAALRLYGEHEFAVPPLAMPDPHHIPAALTLAQYPAVELFVQRAQAVRPGFVLTDENAPAVAAICVRLDGLPLAIELAAARSKLFAPTALLARLESRLGLLTGGARDLPVRQQTLRDAITWSYDLLHAGEQMLFARLGVFVGGCTIEAVEAVCKSQNPNIEEQSSILDGLASLVDKSLLRQEEGPDGEPRFTMLETIREYALDQLEHSGKAEALRKAHAAYYLVLAERAEPELTGPQQVMWLDRLEQEHDNLRAALRSALDCGEVQMSAQLSGALWRFWYMHSHLSEGRRWFSQILASSDLLSAPVRAKVLHGAGVLINRQNDYERGVELIEESLMLNRELGDKKGAAINLLVLSWAAQDQGHFAQAETFLEQSLGLFRELGDKGGIANTLNNLGSLAGEQGNYELAKTFHQESLALRRSLGDRQGIAMSLTNLGDVVRIQGNLTQARALLEESRLLFEQSGDRYGLAITLSNLGDVAQEQGESQQAVKFYQASLELFRVLRDRRSTAECLEGLARAIMRLGRPDQAARLCGAAEALRVAIGTPLTHAQHSQYKQIVAGIRDQLGEPAFSTAWATGRGLTLEQTSALALEQDTLAHTRRRSSNHTGASDVW